MVVCARHGGWIYRSLFVGLSGYCRDDETGSNRKTLLFCVLYVYHFCGYSTRGFSTSMSYLPVFLKPGKEKPVRAFHPWIFSGAIDEIDEAIKPGDLVEVYSSRKEFLGTGYFNSHSQITVRLLAFQKENIDAAFLIKKF